MLTRRGFEHRAVPSECDDLLRRLTVVPNEGSEYGEGAAFCLGRRVAPDRVILPVFYARSLGLCGAGTPHRFRIAQLQSPCEFAAVLTPVQDQAVSCGLSTLRAHGGGILSLQTGGGKTVCAIAIACKLQKPVLILVHKTVLVEQWLQRIRQFAPGASTGVVQQDRVETERDFVVGMLQSISIRPYAPETFDRFGLLIVDEVHHISTPVFSRAMQKVNCPMLLGLSATPTRKDGLTHVLHWFMGDIFYQTSRAACKHVTVVKHQYDHPKYGDAMPVNRMGRVCMTTVTSVLCALQSRTERLVGMIRQMMSENYHILVLSDRVPHCKHIQQMLGDDAGLYVGSYKPVESLAKKAVVSTYALSREGLDVPTLNALVMATPKSDIDQICGRVLRRDSDDSCRPPVIVDFIDNWGVCFAQSRTRMRFYKQCGFSVVT